MKDNSKTKLHDNILLVRELLIKHFDDYYKTLITDPSDIEEYSLDDIAMDLNEFVIPEFIEKLDQLCDEEIYKDG